MKTIISVLLLCFSALGYTRTAVITLENPNPNSGIGVRFIKGHMFESDDLGANTQNMLVDEDKYVYLGPGERKVVYVRLRCFEMDRGAPTPGTPVHPTPTVMPRPGNNPSQTLDEQARQARSRAERLNSARSRERVL